MVHELVIDKMIIHGVLTNVLGMKCITAGLVPKELKFLHDFPWTRLPETHHYKGWAPCDSFLFSKRKLPLGGALFEPIEDIKGNSQCELESTPSSAYAKFMEDWASRYHNRVAHNGNHFEGDQINLMFCVFFKQLRVVFIQKEFFSMFW